MRVFTRAGWVVLLLSITSFACADEAPLLPQLAADPAMQRAPATRPADAFHADGVNAMFYDALPWKGKPTRVFAWYAIPAHRPDEKLPAMVLVHGGGGTAFSDWVKLWTKRGYAAIAMDLCGCVPGGTHGKRPRHDDGGPPGWGGFDQIDWPQQDQWTYHAVADVMLAHSWLRSLPDIDQQRIGITGISWGGYLTCIVAGLDQRFRFAVPVYGCGYLGEDSTWVGVFTKMGSEKSARWLKWWDPSVYLPTVTMPMLWVDGTNDFAYPPDSLQKSYRLPKSPRTLATRVRMPHGHGGPGENPEEIRAFADTFCKSAAPLATITAQGRTGLDAWAKFTSPAPIRSAELNFTRATGPWQKRLWETQPAKIDNDRVTATLPKDATVYYFNLIDDRKLIASSEHEEIKP